MAQQEPTSTDEVAERLRYTRLALKLTQARLCSIAGISTAAWNNAETADARIGLDNAILLCQAFDLTLDWVFRGRRGNLSHDFLQSLMEVETAEQLKKTG